MQTTHIATSRNGSLQLRVIGIEQRQMRLFWRINAGLFGAVVIGAFLTLRGKTFPETTEVSLVMILLTPVSAILGVLVAGIIELALSTWCLVTRSRLTVVRAFRFEWIIRIPKTDITRIDNTDDPGRIEILYASGSVSLGPWSTKSMIPDRWYRVQRARLVGCLGAATSEQ